MNRLVLACALVSSLSFAADLKPGQEEAKAKFDKLTASLVTEVNAACGTHFTAITSDFENFDKADFNRNPPGTR